MKNLFQWGVWMQESIDALKEDDKKTVLRAVSYKRHVHY